MLVSVCVKETTGRKLLPWTIVSLKTSKFVDVLNDLNVGDLKLIAVRVAKAATTTAFNNVQDLMLSVTDVVALFGNFMEFVVEIARPKGRFVQCLAFFFFTEANI